MITTFVSPQSRKRSKGKEGVQIQSDAVVVAIFLHTDPEAMAQSDKLLPNLFGSGWSAHCNSSCTAFERPPSGIQEKSSRQHALPAIFRHFRKDTMIYRPLLEIPRVNTA